MSSDQPLEGLIADYAFSCSSMPLEKELVRHVKRALIDWQGAVISGSVSQPAQIMEKALACELSHGRSRLVSGTMATPRAAAMINAVASHAMEVDDIFRDAIYHPGSPVISAALSVAQADQKSGNDLLRGIVAGYEVSTWIGAAIAQKHCRYWHATGTVGCMGASIGAAVTLGLSREQIRHALSASITFASGLQQAFRTKSLVKPLHAGHAADVGVMTALAARHGLAAAQNMLEGEAGFGKALGGDPDWRDVLPALGASSNIRKMTFKSHFCCGHSFSAIDAILALRDEALPKIEDIESIDIHTYQVALDVVGSYLATEASEARFSMPYMTSYALLNGHVHLNAVSDAALSDSRIRAIMERTKIYVSPDIDARFPKNRPCRLVIRFKNGREIEHYQPDRVGDPELPVSDEKLVAKFRNLSVPVIGADRTEAIHALVFDLENLSAAQLLHMPGHANSIGPHGS